MRPVAPTWCESACPPGDIVHRAAFDRGLERGEPDQRRLVLVGFEDVDATVSDDDSGDAVGRQPVEHVGDQIAGRLLGAPRRGDDLQTGPHLVHAGRSRTVTLSGHSAVNSALVYTDAASSGSWLPGSRYTGMPMARMASSDWLTTRGASWLSSKTSPATTTNSAPASAASGPMPATTSRRAAEYRGWASPFRK
jgi:hypothetical protein